MGQIYLTDRFVTLNFKRLEKKEIQHTFDTFQLIPNQGSVRGFLSSLSRNGESTTNTSKRTVEVGTTNIEDLPRLPGDMGGSVDIGQDFRVNLGPEAKFLVILSSCI